MLKMQRGKEEDKMTGPMFPRLHVNEIDKTGLRAPPRNKMALYEQLSFPPQRFTHTLPTQNPNSATTDLMPSSSQVGRNEKGMLFPWQLPPRHQSEKQYGQYCDSIALSTHAGKRKELDDEDFRVPIFTHSTASMGHGKHTDDLSTDSHFNPSLEVQQAIIYEEENSKEYVACRVETISNSRLNDKTEVEQKQANLSPCHQTGSNPVNSIEKLKTDSNVQPELFSESQFTSNMHGTSVFVENISTSDKKVAFPTMRVLGYDKNSSEDGRRSAEVVNLERGDHSLSETSITYSITGLDITPDDVVGVMGHKHFWTARKSISDQQRLFADQVFELHRLIKVQRSIATSLNFLLGNGTDATKPIKVLPVKKPPLGYPIKALPNISKQKRDAEKLSHAECSAENTVGESALTSLQNTVLPSKHGPTNNNPSYLSNTSNHDARARPLCLNQPHGSHWLIPMMSPSEGLVYKPYSGPGSVSPSCGVWGLPGSNTTQNNNFSTPVHGIPAPYPQYQFPYFHASGSGTYFPAYNIPVTSSFFGSSVQQVNQPLIPNQFSSGNSRIQGNTHGSVSTNLHAYEDIEVQGSTTSSPSEKTQGSESGYTGERRNKLRLFPEPEPPSRVIKVVPHKAGSVTESVARIFRSIQEERKQHSFV